MSVVSWSKECENGLNLQINYELDASHQYLSLYNYFNKDNVGLVNLSNYFKKCSDEEREHAFKMIQYQQKRGGTPKLTTINSYNHNFDNNSNKILDAFQLICKLEEDIYVKLKELHKIGEESSDPQFTDFIEGEFLSEQVDAIYEIKQYISQLKLIGNNGHGLWNFNQQFNN